MIDSKSLRIGNYILHKSGVRILPVKVNFEHFELLSKGLGKDMFPIALKRELLLKCGFIENPKYYLLPNAREFVLALPVQGANIIDVQAYIPATNEVYARATVNELIVTNNIHYLHQLQNLYHAIAAIELEITI
jgi:hypothetical protein